MWAFNGAIGLGHALLVAASLLVYVLATRIGHQYRHPSAALAWVLGMVAFPYVTLPLFLLFGTRKYARPPRHRFSPERVAAIPVPADAPAWATRLLAGMELAPAERNGAITFQEDGPQSLQALLALIDSAKHTLELSTFLYRDDAVGQTVMAALERCVQRGVTTRLLLDAVGSFQTPRRQLRQWLRAGVRVRRFMPLLRNPLHGRSNLRNHRKVAVADGARLWSGGRNLAAEYFTDCAGRSAWVDLSFVVHGPLAAQAQAQFLADWHTAGGRPLRFNRVPLRPSANAPQQGALAQWVPSGPDHADDTAHSLLMSGAYQAQQHIRAVSPYFVPDDALLDAWCLACRRGVQVSVLLPARSNHRLADW
ncbi:MAG: PLDc N-terminal domain-containing protein, partial [Giesbergeria sp.]|nr:PLDc N-terminal domain-containing protein [Giesbergeria sp.]